MKKEHPTKEELDDYLLAPEESPWKNHVLGCEQCCVKAKEFQEAIKSFNQVGLLWGERVSATLPPVAEDCKTPVTPQKCLPKLL